jgi:hypothetical protein
VDPTSDFTFFFFFFFAKTVELSFPFSFHPGKCSLKGIITKNKSIFGYCGVQALSCNAFILRHTLHLFDTNRVNHLPGPIFLKPIYSNEAHIKGYVNEKNVHIYIYIYLIHNLGYIMSKLPIFNQSWICFGHMGKDH